MSVMLLILQLYAYCTQPNKVTALVMVLNNMKSGSSDVEENDEHNRIGFVERATYICDVWRVFL